MKTLIATTSCALLLILPELTCYAQGMLFGRDDFKDGDHQDHAPFNWQQGTWPGGELFVDDEGLKITNCPSGGCAIAHQLTDGSWNAYQDVSLRLQAKIIDGTGSIVPWGRWTNQSSYYGSVRPFRDELVVGIGSGVVGSPMADASLVLDENRDVIVKFDLIGGEYGMSAWNAGDSAQELPLLFGKDDRFHQGVLGVSLFSDDVATIVYRWIEVAEILPGDVDTNSSIDASDIDYLTWAIDDKLENNRYDVDRNGTVDASDRSFWVNEIKQTWFGDTNLDGEFNSNDLVNALVAGTYQSDVDSNWASGDFDGNGKFDSGDLIFALADGGYEQGPRAATTVVPEPTSLALMLVGLGWLIRSARCQDGTFVDVLRTFSTWS